MPSRAVLLLAIGLAASSLLGAEATGAPDADGGTQAGAAPGSKSGSKPPDDPGRARPHGKVQDREIVEHLEEIERLELLQHLELFDTAAPRK